MTKEDFKERQREYKWFWSDENKGQTLIRYGYHNPFNLPLPEVKEILRRRYDEERPLRACSDKLNANRISNICETFHRIAQLQMKFNVELPDDYTKMVSGSHLYCDWLEMFERYKIPWVRGKILSAAKVFYINRIPIEEIARKYTFKNVRDAENAINQFKIIVSTRKWLNESKLVMFKDRDEILKDIKETSLLDAGYPRRLVKILQRDKCSKMTPMQWSRHITSKNVKDVDVLYEDLLSYSESELLKLYDIGPSSIQFIKSDLEILGLKLKEEKEDAVVEKV